LGIPGKAEKRGKKSLGAAFVGMRGRTNVMQLWRRISREIKGTAKPGTGRKVPREGRKDVTNIVGKKGGKKMSVTVTLGAVGEKERIRNELKATPHGRSCTNHGGKVEPKSPRGEVIYTDLHCNIESG